MPNTAIPSVGSKRVQAKKAPVKKLTSKPRVETADNPVVGPKKAVLVVDSLQASYQAARDLELANAINNVAARNSKVAFTASNPNVKKDQSTSEVVKNALDFKIGRKVKVIKIVDRRGNVECILKGRIKEMTTVGAYVSDFDKPGGRAEWFPFKSKMQWILLA